MLRVLGFDKTETLSVVRNGGECTYSVNYADCVAGRQICCTALSNGICLVPGQGRNSSEDVSRTQVMCLEKRSTNVKPSRY